MSKKPSYPAVDPSVVTGMAVVVGDRSALSATWPEADFVARVGGGYWRIDFAADATDKQKADALAGVATFDPTAITGAQVDLERDRRIALGVTVTVSGATFGVQTRDADDFRNINGLGTAALALTAQGSKVTVPFRDAANASHDLALADVLSMGLQVTVHVQALYAASWALKAMSPIPTDYVNDKYWA